jgi:hypothetical protein
VNFLAIYLGNKVVADTELLYANTVIMRPYLQPYNSNILHGGNNTGNFAGIIARLGFFLMFCVKGGEIDCKGCPEQGSPNCRRVHEDFVLISVYNFQSA